MFQFFKSKAEQPSAPVKNIENVPPTPYPPKWDKSLSLERSSETIRDCPVYIDEKTGEKFLEVPKTLYPVTQRFAGLFLKNIINTADVVPFDGKYFTHVQNRDFLPITVEDAKVEALADACVLKIILGDTDHRFRESPFENRDGWYEHKNILIGEGNTKVAHFDLEQVVGLQKFRPEDAELSMRTLVRESAEYPFPTDALNIVRMKLNQMNHTFFSSPEGFKHFKETVEQSGAILEDGDNITFPFFEFETKIKDERITELYEDLKERVRFTESIIPIRS